MILAHTRGLLEPDYKYGVRSVVRENMVLGCLEKETQASGFFARATADSASLGVFKPEARLGLIQSVMANIMQGVALQQFTSYKKVSKMGAEVKDMSKIKETGRVFKLLKRTDFYARMHALLKKHIK